MVAERRSSTTARVVPPKSKYGFYGKYGGNTSAYFGRFQQSLSLFILIFALCTFCSCLSIACVYNCMVFTLPCYQDIRMNSCSGSSLDKLMMMLLLISCAILLSGILLPNLKHTIRGLKAIRQTVLGPQCFEGTTLS